jgi:hypothetical protein
MTAMTGLERAVYDCIRAAHKNLRLPEAGDVVVLDRTNTGAGRFVKLSGITAATCQLGKAGSYLDMGGAFLEIPGVPNGLMAVLAVDADGAELEIATYGTHSWDGDETGWRLVP